MDTSFENINKSLLGLCLKQVEEKLGWGNSQNWPAQNFERLSEKIYSQTGIKISHNTLKRLWGRIPYKSNPSTTTLDTLAKFIEFENWSAFVANTSTETEGFNRVESVKKYKANWKSRRNILMMFLSVIGIIIVLSISLPKSNDAVDDFSFTSKKVSTGIPNSVIFKVDVSNAQPADKIEIQQNWDASRRQQIDRHDSLVASIYYNPGYFDAKLVINDQIIREHSLLIPSEGWIARLGTKKTPIYFEKEEFETDEGVEISSDLIKSRNADIPPSDTYINFYWVEDFKGLKLNDFVMETRLRNIPLENTRGCQRVEIILLCEGEVIIIPLSIKGCIADLNFFFLGTSISGSRNDLSKFGVDFSTWVDVKCVSKEGLFSIYINNILAYEISTNGKNNRIYGVKYRFQGTGAISKLKMSNKSRVFVDE